MSQIPIHKERGLDPHLCFCRRCGEDTGAMTVGAMVKYETPDGRLLYAQAGKGSQAARDAGINILQCKKLEVEAGEKVPDIELCSNCEKELENFHAIVKAGGVYFRCKECENEGVIRKSEFADEVRRLNKVEAPAPCGVEFDTCSQHTGEGEKLAASSAEENENEQ